MSVKIKDTDKGAAKMLARLLADGALSVGVLGADAGAAHEDSDLTVGDIAEIHEFGLGTAPRRSFLAGWVDENKEQIVTVVTKAGQALARGRLANVNQALEQIGVWAVGSIQIRMSNNIPPPLAPATIKRKGSSIALIDTGQLRSSISHRVEFGAGGA